MSQHALPNRRPPTPAETARTLYRGVFAAQTHSEQELASKTWLALEPSDRSFITCHLQYLILMAQARNEHLLMAIRESRDNVTGATIAIADVVTAAGLEVDRQERALQDPSDLDADWREAERRLGTQPSSSPSPELEFYQPIENPPPVADALNGSHAASAATHPALDAGQVAASVLPVPPADRGPRLSDALLPVGPSKPGAARTTPASERKRSGSKKSGEPAQLEEGSHVE